MNSLLIVYIALSWLLLAGLMWSDWFEDKKPGKSIIGFFMLLFYVVFMPVIWLSRIGRN